MMGWGVQAEHGWRKGPWTPEEDKLLSEYVSSKGEGRWSSVARSAGLNRSGKSCRLRWVNYLRPGLKRCQITPQEEGVIIELHALWGNKWSTIARYLPGRTDNEIKNYWRTHFKKRSEKSSFQKKDKKRITTQLLMQKQQPIKQQKQQEEEEEEDGTYKKASLIIHPKPEEISVTKTHEAQQGRHELQQNMALMKYPSLIEDQFLSAMYQLDTASSPWSDAIGDDGFWGGGLWNLEDNPHGQTGHGHNANDSSKVAMKTQANAFSL